MEITFRHSNVPHRCRLRGLFEIWVRAALGLCGVQNQIVSTRAASVGVPQKWDKQMIPQVGIRCDGKTASKKETWGPRAPAG